MSAIKEKPTPIFKLYPNLQESILKAKEAGYSDDEILQYLDKLRTRAYHYGYSYDEIKDFFGAPDASEALRILANTAFYETRKAAEKADEAAWSALTHPVTQKALKPVSSLLDFALRGPAEKTLHELAARKLEELSKRPPGTSGLRHPFSPEQLAALGMLIPAAVTFPLHIAGTLGEHYTALDEEEQKQHILDKLIGIDPSQKGWIKEAAKAYAGSFSDYPLATETMTALLAHGAKKGAERVAKKIKPGKQKPKVPVEETIIEDPTPYTVVAKANKQFDFGPDIDATQAPDLASRNLLPPAPKSVEAGRPGQPLLREPLKQIEAVSRVQEAPKILTPEEAAKVIAEKIIRPSELAEPQPRRKAPKLLSDKGTERPPEPGPVAAEILRQLTKASPEEIKRLKARFRPRRLTEPTTELLPYLKPGEVPPGGKPSLVTPSGRRLAPRVTQPKADLVQKASEEIKRPQRPPGPIELPPSSLRQLAPAKEPESSLPPVLRSKQPQRRAAHDAILSYVKKYEDELRRTKRELKRAKFIDEQFGLLTSYGDEKLTTRVISLLQRQGKPARSLTKFYLDLHGFKAINTKAGYPAGDKILKLVGDTLREIGNGKSPVRIRGFVAHKQGDEFIFTAKIGKEDAPRLAQEMKRHIDSKLKEFAESEGYPVPTIDIGLKTIEVKANHVPKEEAKKLTLDAMQDLSEVQKRLYKETGEQRRGEPKPTKPEPPKQAASEAQAPKEEATLVTEKPKPPASAPAEAASASKELEGFSKQAKDQIDEVLSRLDKAISLHRDTLKEFKNSAESEVKSITKRLNVIEDKLLALQKLKMTPKVEKQFRTLKDERLELLPQESALKPMIKFADLILKADETKDPLLRVALLEHAISKYPNLPELRAVIFREFFMDQAKAVLHKEIIPKLVSDKLRDVKMEPRDLEAVQTHFEIPTADLLESSTLQEAVDGIFNHLGKLNNVFLSTFAQEAQQFHPDVYLEIRPKILKAKTFKEKYEVLLEGREKSKATYEKERAQQQREAEIKAQEEKEKMQKVEEKVESQVKIYAPIIESLQDLDADDIMDFLQAAKSNKRKLSFHKNSQALKILQEKGLVSEGIEKKNKSIEVRVTEEGYNIADTMFSAMISKDVMAYFPFKKVPTTRKEPITIISQLVSQMKKRMKHLVDPTRMLNVINEGYFTDAHILIKLDPELQKLCKNTFAEDLKQDVEPFTAAVKRFKEISNQRSIDAQGPLGVIPDLLQNGKFAQVYVFKGRNNLQVAVPELNIQLMEAISPKGKYVFKKGFEGLARVDEAGNMVGCMAKIRFADLGLTDNFVSLFENTKKLIGDYLRKTLSSEAGAWRFHEDPAIRKVLSKLDKAARKAAGEFLRGLKPESRRAAAEAFAGTTSEKKAARRIIQSELYTPVKGSRISQAAHAFMRSNDINQYFEHMQDVRDPSKVDPVRPDFVSAFYGINSKGKPIFKGKDIPKAAREMFDITRIIESIDFNKSGGVAAKYILWPARDTIRARMQYELDRKEYVTDLVKKYKIKGKKKEAMVWDILNGNSVPNAPKEVRSFSKAMRSFLDHLLEEQNKARERRGQALIPHRQDYVPWVVESVWKDRLLGEKTLPKDIMEGPEVPDYIQPNKPFNPRELPREADYNAYVKRKDVLKLLSDYIATAAKDIFNTNVIYNNKLHAKFFENIGMKNAADALMAWTTETFGGLPHSVDRFLHRLPQPVQTALRLQRRLKKGLMLSIFPLNFTWNFAVQTTANVMLFPRVGIKNFARAIHAVHKPEIRKIINDTYTYIVKSASNPEVAAFKETIKAFKILDKPSKLDTLSEQLNFMTIAIEKACTNHAIAAGILHGRELGLKGRALLEYAGEVGAKTQGMYNLEDLPGLLRSKEIKSAAPLQTFAFEALNNLRDITEGVGSYLGITKGAKLRRLIKFVVGIETANLFSQVVAGRDSWSIISFIPFGAQILSLAGIELKGYRYDAYKPTLGQFATDFRRTLRNAVLHDDWRDARALMMRYFVPAGTPIERAIEGYEDAQRGARKDAIGRKHYTVRPDETLKVMLHGSAASEGARRKREKEERKTSMLEKILGGKRR